MADEIHDWTDDEIAKVERHLSAIYRRAEKELEATADEYFHKFKKQDEINKKSMDEDEYIEWRKKKMLFGEKYKEMQDKVAHQLLHINETAIDYLNGELPEVYAKNYNALAKEVDGVGGYSFTLTDSETVKNLATKEETLLPYKEVDGIKDVRWNTKAVNAEVLQGVLQGESVNKIAKRMRNVLEMNKNSAYTNARTTITSAECKGRQDSYERAQDDGIILKKKWISTNDSRTRHGHQELNGVEVGVNEAFHNVLQLSKHKRIADTIRFPGDPNAHPCNVYNCRCTIAARVVGFRKKEED